MTDHAETVREFREMTEWLVRRPAHVDVKTSVGLLLRLDEALTALERERDEAIADRHASDELLGSSEALRVALVEENARLREAYARLAKRIRLATPRSMRVTEADLTTPDQEGS